MPHRGHGDSATPSRQFASTSSSPGLSCSGQHSALSRGRTADTRAIQSHHQSPLLETSGTLLPDMNQSLAPDPLRSVDYDWSSWLSAQTEDIDFNSLHSLSGQLRGQEYSEKSMSSASLRNVTSPTDFATMDRSALRNGTASNARTNREIAKGMAMVTLEAAAEPHYVGESSGSFWSSVITHGMSESTGNRGERRNNKRPRDRSPSPTDRHILRASLQRQISNDVARHVLLTVYQHLHSRVSPYHWALLS
jgi:hypothetical protein